MGDQTLVSRISRTPDQPDHICPCQSDAWSARWRPAASVGRRISPTTVGLMIPGRTRDQPDLRPAASVGHSASSTASARIRRTLVQLDRIRSRPSDVGSARPRPLASVGCGIQQTMSACINRTSDLTDAGRRDRTDGALDGLSNTWLTDDRTGRRQGR
jgi:hypothetical protein